MTEPVRRTLPALFCLALVAASRAADPTPALTAAAREELPAPLVAIAAPGALRYEGAEGRYRLDVGEMDGAAPVEGVLAAQAAGKAVRVVFLAEADGKVVRKAVKLPGSGTGGTVTTFLPFAEGKTLAQVQGGAAGAVLLAWDGRKLEVVWDSGKPSTTESRWFELEDLDDDKTLEVVAYHRRALDTAPEDELSEQAGGGASATEEAAPLSVLRWNGSRWEKSEELLRGLR
jgi:hypothetical protein